TTSASKRSGPQRTRAVLAPWVRDAVGIGLVVVALLAVMSVWYGSAGPAGRGLSLLLHGRFGIAVFVYPILGVWWGIVLLRDIEPDDRLRMAIGTAIVIFGALGIVSLLRGDPSPLAGYAPAGPQPGVSRAGGVLGALAAWPLARVISKVGAAIIDVGALSLGLLVVTGTPVAAVGRKISELRAARDAADPVRATARDGRPARKERERTVVLPEAEPPALEEAESAEPGEPATPPRPRTVRTDDGPYQLPPLDLLRTAPASSADGRDEEQTMQALERTLRTFGVDARVTQAHRGPTVTMYEVDIAAGTKVNK